VKITTLIENHQHPDRPVLRAEHGVSFYVEDRGHVLLSDVGQSSNFADNAAKLGVDLTDVEALAISHHHYDHGGGLDRFFKENTLAPVYLRKAPPDVDYIVDVKDQPVRYIGLDKDLLGAFDQRIEYITGNTEILPGFHLLTDIPEVYPKPSGDKRLKMQRGDVKKPDTFEHELVTVVEGEVGLVILTGCGHNGVLNMIVAACKAFPGKSIQAVIGGFHLHHEEEGTVRKVGEELLNMDIPAVVTGHCTGENAVAVLADVLGHRLQRLYTGLVLTY